MMEETDSIDLRIRGRIRYVSGRSTPVLSKVMGLMLLVYSMLYTYMCINRVSFNTSPISNVIGIVIIVTCAFLILIDFSCNLNRTIGLYAIGIGGNRFFRFINYIYMDMAGNQEFIILVLFIFGIVMAVTSLNLVYTGYIFLKGQTRSRVSMTITSSIMLVLTIAILFVMAQISSMPILEVLSSAPDLTAMLFLYVMLICILGTKTIRDTDMSEHYISVLNSIRHTESTSDNSYIYRSTAKEIVDSYKDKTGWIPFNDEGPVECEYRFRIVNRMDDISYVRIQKWKDSEELYFTISDSDSGSMINAYRFAANGMELDGPADTCEFLHIYGDKIHMKIKVRNDPEKKKWGLNYDI